MKPATSHDVHAALNFVDKDSASDPNGALFLIDYDPESWPSNSPKANYRLCKTNVLIHDARPYKDNLSLDKEGFIVLENESFNVKCDDAQDEKELLDTFAPELRKELKHYLGAQYIFFHECVIRKRDHPSAEYGVPVYGPHIDYTVEELRKQILGLVEDKAPSLLSRRVQAINIWKPLKGPLRDNPLALCDATTVEPTDSRRSMTIFREGSLENLRQVHSPRQKWYYLRDQLPEEVWVFKSADSLHNNGVQVLTATLYCFLSAGIVFGYAALKPILIRSHAYRYLCPSSYDEDKPCIPQELRLNLIFITAAVGTNMAALPVGFILDRFGPLVCASIGSVSLTVGALLLAFGGKIQERYKGSLDGYIPGYLFLALGGSFVFLSSFHLSNAFPRRSGLALACLTGAFDSSSAVFLGYRLLYQWTEGKASVMRFFLAYLLVPAFIASAQLGWMPGKVYKTVGELKKDAEDGEGGDQVFEEEVPGEEADEETALLHNRHQSSAVSPLTDLLGRKPVKSQRRLEERKNKISGVWGVLHGSPLCQQLLFPFFHLITLFTIIQMLRINYFMATIRPQYSYLLDPSLAVSLNTFFDIALPLGGLISIPLTGMILDYTSTLFVLSTLLLLSTTIGILGCLPYEFAAYANIAIFVIYRPFYYTAISDYVAKVFGFTNFGTVYGLLICISGICNFAQSGLDNLLHRTFNGDPVPNNVGLTVAGALVGMALCGYVGWKARGIERDNLEREAEGAREVVMPGAEEPERL